jgi:hypothetical protein
MEPPPERGQHVAQRRRSREVTIPMAPESGQARLRSASNSPRGELGLELLEPRAGAAPALRSSSTASW